jgi:hypothetical protein
MEISFLCAQETGGNLKRRKGSNKVARQGDRKARGSLLGYPLLGFCVSVDSERFKVLCFVTLL